VLDARRVFCRHHRRLPRQRPDVHPVFRAGL
jgi:hypothetical protein